MENFTAFLSILTAVSILAPFVIEAVKKLLSTKNYDINTLSAGITAVIALVVCVAYMIVTSVPITATVIVYVIGTIFFSVLGSLCGYDKVLKLIFQLFKKEGEA